jgi:SRSO17 transposase
MASEFETRKQQLLDECEIKPKLFDQALARLQAFMKPFVQTLVRQEQLAHAETLVRGLLSDVEHKNVESIAYYFGQERMPLQWFVGVSDWKDEPLREELVRQLGAELGEAEGVMVFDPSSFPKSGRSSVGVARQWCGRLGKTENCQVAVYLGYVSGKGQALADTRLYLGQEWTGDRTRCDQAGVPKQVGYRTRHQLALEMLSVHGESLPHSWLAGDDEMGRPYWFRRRLERDQERYLLAVASNTLIRDLDTAPPPYAGRGAYPKRPWQRVDHWPTRQAESAWEKIDVRDGEKGPLVVEAIKTRVVARTEKRQAGHEEVLVVIRYKDRDEQVVKTDYYLSNAHASTPLTEFARVAKAEHRIEECLQRAKSEAGLGDYEVRNWTGWQHHQTLSLLAAWFLVSEAQRGKKNHPRDYAPADSSGDRVAAAASLRMRYPRPPSVSVPATSPTQPACAPVSLETT